jgi:hypothetical protein
MNIERRSLYVTVKMLQSAGIEAVVRFVDGKVHLSLANPRGARPLVATFEKTEAARAANWLAACAVHFYPKSDLAKVWRVLAQAAASAEPYDG